MRDGFGRLTRRAATHIQVITASGVFYVNIKTHRIEQVPNKNLGDLIGIRVELDGGWMMNIDIEPPRELYRFTTYRKVTIGVTPA